ncbi:hypothetical protein [Maritimibacter sp. DP1N21-5]|uniref:hypothetical protein n=1 Tax=Maritimibacter sp. DP1N21-5 TaxID=2836867 RepID=UPI001C47727B|nr:hypothetical protein [Maritimibacter sp. DP1N21-5]MBV7409282.1 hypothetical protein [Maritimibacter sp. DP1N21-5]
MVYVTNTTLRPSPKRVIRIGRIVFAVLPAAAGGKTPRRVLPKRLTQSVPEHLHRDVGLPPAAKPSRMPPDILGRTMM